MTKTQTTARIQLALQLIRLLTSNLNLLFHKQKWFAVSWVMILFTGINFYWCTPAFGIPQTKNTRWTIAPDLDIEPAEDKRLHTRTPTIESPGDFSVILNALALRHPFARLSFDQVGDQWQVNGVKGVAVSQISFELAPFHLMTILRNTVNSFVGQVHSQQLLEKIISDIQSTLVKYGYFKPQVIPSVIETGDDVHYLFKLDIGEPCIVMGFKWEQPPPIRVDHSLRIGDICTMEEAAKAIAETENKARAMGYTDANLTFDRFETIPHSNNAYVKVSGKFGAKVIYEFVDQSTGKSLNSIFSNTDMQAFDPAILSPESVSFELARQLKTRGYSDVQVSAPVTGDSKDNNQIYRFNVKLGDVSYVSRIQLDGNVSYSESEIFDLLGIERPNDSEERTSGVVYNEAGVESGVERIRSYYINHGFWDAKVTDRKIQSQTSDLEKNRIVVVISIEEGDQRIFSALDITGNKAIDSDDLNELSPLEIGTPLDRSKIVEVQQKIRSFYAAKGYFYTSVTSDTKSHSQGSNQLYTTVLFKIDEGPRVKFGDVFITGLVRTAPKVVMRELIFEAGDWYDPEEVSATRKALLRLGIFSTVIISPLDSDLAFKRSETVDLVVQVTESPTRTVNFGPGWSSYYGMRYNLEGTLSNLWGTGRSVFGRATFDEEAQQKAIGDRTLIGRSISGGYTEPHILDSNLDGTLSLSQAARASDVGWKLTRGGELEISHTLRTIVPGSKISGYYGRLLNDEEGTNQDVNAFLADTFSVGRVGLRFLLDKRNDPAWVSSGYTIGSELSWARYELGGDLRYFRWDISNNHYVSPFENLVFAFGVNYTSFENIERRGSANGDVLPASERLTAGGADTIRGFKEKSLGPIVRRPTLDANNLWDCGFTESTTGGSRRLILKFETRYRFTSSFATTLFVDSGSTSFSHDEMKKFEAAFAQNPVLGQSTTCPNSNPQRSIRDNIGYEINDIFIDPKLLWEKNYSSTGTALNFLTPIGSINLAYGVPWHEPSSEKCQVDMSYCYPRSDQSVPLWRRGEVHFNVGAKF